MTLLETEKYIEAVQIIMDRFRYEFCSDCGGDLQEHAITPGLLFGLPVTVCLNYIEEN